MGFTSVGANYLCSKIGKANVTYGSTQKRKIGSNWPINSFTRYDNFLKRNELLILIIITAEIKKEILRMNISLRTIYHNFAFLNECQDFYTGTVHKCLKLNLSRFLSFSKFQIMPRLWHGVHPNGIQSLTISRPTCLELWLHAPGKKILMDLAHFPFV